MNKKEETKIEDYRFGYRAKAFTDVAVIDDIRQRYKHTYVIGKPGVGKSSMLENLIQQDLDNGYSVIYIDPKGDSSEKLYYMNKDKVKYVDFDHPIGLNPLKKNYSLDLIASEFSDIVNVMTSETSSNVELTVRMKSILTNMIKGVDEKDLNINFFIKFLNDFSIRENYTFNVETREFWKSLNNNKFPFSDKFNKFNLTMSSISERLSMFLLDSRMNKFLESCEFDIDNLMDSGKSLFVNISDGVSESKRFLANLIVYSVISYSYLKTNQKPLFVYVDEFQYCASRAFSDALRICRSKNIGFILSHQDFEGIDKDLVNAILNIVDNFVVFRVGLNESDSLSRLFGVRPDVLMDFPDYHAYLKYGNKRTVFFTFNPIVFEYKRDSIITFLSDEWI